MDIKLDQINYNDAWSFKTLTKKQEAKRNF